MRQFRLFGGIEGYYRFMKTVISINKSQGNKTAQYRLDVLCHYWQFGVASTLDAFPVSRASLFRWQKDLKKNDGKLQSLIPKSTRPKRVRTMQVPDQLIDKIKSLRKTWPNLSKHKIKPLLDIFCRENGYKQISPTTIGEVIRRHKFFFKDSGRSCHDPNRKKQAKKKKIRVYKAPKHQEGYVEADLVETRADGQKKYTACFIDIGSKVAFSKTLRRKTSQNILQSFLEFEEFNPSKIRVFQTDNGSEFEGALDNFLRKERPNILRKYTPVRTPKINGVIERYNRSLQDDWLKHHLHLFHDDENWSQSLKSYVYFYNYQRVHEALQYKHLCKLLGCKKVSNVPDLYTNLSLSCLSHIIAIFLVEDRAHLRQGYGRAILPRFAKRGIARDSVRCT